MKENNKNTSLDEKKKQKYLLRWKKKITPAYLQLCHEFL